MARERDTPDPFHPGLRNNPGAHYLTIEAFEDIRELIDATPSHGTQQKREKRALYAAVTIVEAVTSAIIKLGECVDTDDHGATVLKTLKGKEGD